MIIERKIEVLKKFIAQEEEDRLVLQLKIRLFKRKVHEANEATLLEINKQVQLMTIGVKSSKKYQEYLEEVLAELEKGNDFELSDIPTA